MRPVAQLATLCEAAGVRFDPEPADVPALLLDSLNMSGIEESFHGVSATDLHPGAWWDRFAQAYVDLAAGSDCPADQRAAYSIQLALKREAGAGLVEKIDIADQAVSEMQNEILGRIVPNGGEGESQSDAILLATEVAIDFRAMQRTINSNLSYNAAAGYVALLLGDELTSVYVRLKHHDGQQIDFRTASYIAGNHIGGARHASAAAQQMHTLLKGRDLSPNFFEEAMYRKFKDLPPKGAGLRFRVSR